MEPRIQYAKTSDGVNIAYVDIGQGPPLVYMAEYLLSPLSGELNLREAQPWFSGLSSGRRVIMFDPRGCGLSQRRPTNYSLETFVEDLRAVVDAAGVERFDLWGGMDAGAVSVVAAARWPERVRSMILWFSYAASTEILESETFRYLDGLVDTNWPLLTETVVKQVFAWSAPEASRLAACIREGLDRDTWKEFLTTSWQWDVSDLLNSVRCPVLVMQRTGHMLLPVETSTNLAARIPGAILKLLPGNAMYPWVGNVSEVLRVVDEFLGLPAGRAATQRELPSGTAIILFADIVDSTALTERLGDTAFREKARELDGALRAVIRDNGGTPIEGKLLGDGVLAVFTSARQAIEAALACGRAGDDGGLPLHLGLHAGDVIRESDPDGRSNVYGGAVNIASRISGLSAPGEVLVSDTVRGLARTSAGVTFEDRGEQALKGVGELVRVWAVQERAG